MTRLTHVTDHFHRMSHWQFMQLKNDHIIYVKMILVTITAIENINIKK